jgi:hypothetical protein
MSAQAQKMRTKLAAYAKEREIFEEKRKELELEMTKGRQNMGKIQKGLRNNEIVDEPMDISTLNPVDSAKKPTGQNKNLTLTTSQKLKSRPTTRATNTSRSGVDDGKTPRVPFDSAGPAQAIVIPSGPRVSDWCYIGPFESDPPVVKSNDVYEVVRLLGRGAFGDVNLVKCIEDSRL